MTAADYRSLAEAVTAAQQAVDRLGFSDLAEEIRHLRAFFGGDVVVAVAGDADAGRMEIAAAIAAAQPAATVLGLEPGRIPEFPVWDVLVVTTPAIRALNQNELQALQNARAWHCPSALVVTRIDRIAEAGARAKIESRRIRPALAGSGARWWFTDAGDPPGDFLDFIRQATSGDPVALHEAAGRTTLERILSDASGTRLEEQLRRRAHEVAAVRTAEQQLSLTVVTVGDEAGRVPRGVEGAVRELDNRLWAAADALARGALAWVAREGKGDWADVEEPMRDGWRVFQESLDTVLADVRDRFRAEAGRLDNELRQVQEDLDVRFDPEVPGLPGLWSDPDAGMRRAALAAVDLEPLLAVLRDTCARAIEKNESGSPEPAAEDLAPRQAPSALRRGKAIADKIGDMVREAATAPFEDRIAAEIHRDLEAATRDKLDRFGEAAARTAERAARADAAAASAALGVRFGAIRSAIEERYAWGSAYAEIVALLAWLRST